MSTEGEPRKVAIAGGGLAGLALGVGLRRAGVSVAIFEAGDYPRHRVCGEFITGLPAWAVERLGIGDVFESALSHAEVDWYAGDRRVARLRLPEKAIGLSRFVLDARLASLFTALGGRLLTQHRMQAWTAGEGVVWAAGRRRKPEAPWVGLKAHVRGLETGADLELHLGDQAYVGLSRVEDGWVNVCGLFRRGPGLRADSPEALAATVRGRGLEQLARRLEAAEVRRGSACAVAGFDFDTRVRFREDVTLGDSCAVVPPFVGNGMAMAVIGAALAVEPLVDWSLHGETWERTRVRIHEALRREFHVRLHGSAWLHPWLLEKKRQGCLTGLAKAGLLPMRALYRVLH